MPSEVADIIDCEPAHPPDEAPEPEEQAKKPDKDNLSIGFQNIAGKLLQKIRGADSQLIWDDLMNSDIWIWEETHHLPSDNGFPD